MAFRKQFEIVYDVFNKRWNFKPQGLPGPLKVSKNRDELIQLAIPICNHQPCVLRICSMDGQIEEERSFGKDG